MPAKSSRSPEDDTTFFTALGNGHSVRAACDAAGYVRSCVYLWRRDDKEFAAQWAEAVVIAGDLLEEEADRRGRDGYDEPVFFQGEIKGAKRKFSDPLLLARLKAVLPDKYRERITMPAIGQQSVTVVVRDFDAEDLMLRLVADNKLSVGELPPRLRARLTKPSLDDDS